jgi:long-chain-fatty-acid--[acyl-carrier-protein] ligase
MIVLRWFFWLVARLILPLRYRIRVRGLETLRDLKGGTLILPNHPAYIDPTILLTTLWPKLRPRPLLAESMFLNPFFYPFMKLVNALRVPDLDRPSAEARQRAEQAIQDTIAALRRGENVILWPAGHVERNGEERLGGARALSDILSAVPEAKVLLVRTRGLFGSRFSYARTGQAPSFAKGMLAGIGWLLANLLFFMPRRRVDITLEKLDRRQLPSREREQVNRWFENWYNAPGPEQPTFVPYHFLFGPRTYEFPKVSSMAEVDLSRVKAETKAAVNHLVAEKLKRPLSEEEQQPQTSFDQLGVDSLTRMDLTLEVERQFSFSADEVPVNLGQLWVLAQGLIEKGPPRPPPPEWFQPPSDLGPAVIHGNTIAEAFVIRALACRKDVCVADDLAGALTYERLLVGSLTLAKRFTPLPSPNVGLLLPSSVGCDMALMGLYLAGKLPVVLNWTTGPANLEHAAQVMKLTHVVTSKAFIDRMQIKIPGIEYLFLEVLRTRFSKWELLRTLWSVRWFPGSVRQRVPQVNPDQPAVVLFTSGSERAPKAVPLTHTNLLTNQRDGIEVLGLTRKDSALGFLPAFHSFGFSVTGLLPLLAGVRMVRHPDPTDAGGLVRKIAAYKPTILVGTPTFVSYLLDRAKPGDLASLRVIIVGAEKAPPALFERVKELAPSAALLEGYGITECAPVVAANRPGAIHPGTVGQALPHVALCVVDVDSGEPLPPGKRGMLLVSGPSVFPGYLGYEGPSPFREMNGKRWYITGDLVEMDPEGYVTFSGRLKRFLKAGGEMISLPALEEPFVKRYPPTEEGPRVAVEGVETENGRRIVLFTIEEIDLHQANAILREEGFHGVMRLDEVRRVDKIPVLGTGKTDYKVLRAQLTEPSAETK